MTKNTIYANRARALTNIWVLRVYAPDEPPNIGAKRWSDARFKLACQPEV